MRSIKKKLFLFLFLLILLVILYLFRIKSTETLKLKKPKIKKPKIKKPKFKKIGKGISKIASKIGKAALIAKAHIEYTVLEAKIKAIPTVKGWGNLINIRCYNDFMRKIGYYINKKDHCGVGQIKSTKERQCKIAEKYRNKDKKFKKIYKKNCEKKKEIEKGPKNSIEFQKLYGDCA
jgi:hypothetical protein